MKAYHLIEECLEAEVQLHVYSLLMLQDLVGQRPDCQVLLRDQVFHGSRHLTSARQHLVKNIVDWYLCVRILVRHDLECL